MEFQIYKTMDEYDKDCRPACPIDGAYFKDFDRIERKTCTEKIFNEQFSSNEGAWRSKGFDHKTYEWGIERKHKNGGSAWFIEINTLDELLAVIKKCETDICMDEVSIEIYNAYRE